MPYEIPAFLLRKTAARILKEIADGRGGMELRNPMGLFAGFLNRHGIAPSNPDAVTMKNFVRWMDDTLWKRYSAVRYTDLFIRLMKQCIFDENDFDELAKMIVLSLIKNPDCRPAACTSTISDFDPLEELPAPDDSWQSPFMDDPDDPQEETSEDQYGTTAVTRYDTPKAIYEYLDSHVYGQTEAKRAVSMLLFNHLNGRERNMLFIGPTGCGKTEIMRQLKNIYPDTVIADSSTITQNGWKGNNKLSDIFSVLPYADAGNAIYVFDEFDKLIEPKVGSSGTDWGCAAQNEFLKVIEGGDIDLGGKRLSLKHASFIFLGSFEEMIQKKNKETEAGRISIGFGSEAEASHKESISYTTRFTPEDLVKYAGMRREIAGRISTIVQLSPMTAKDFMNIIKDPEMSPVSALSREYGKSIEIPDEAADRLCIEAERSHMGVRYLKARIAEELDKKIFDDPDSNAYILFRDSTSIASRGEDSCIP